MSDPRGEVVPYNFNGTDYLLVFTRQGFLRGGEIHRGEQYNIVLDGRVKWVTPNDIDICEPLTLITTEKDTPHMMESLTDSLLIEWRQYPLEKPVNYYEPYRELVREKMNKG